ncbi:MAG TPA: 50S ribosomal protein L21 [Patescibacteria group bacterium]|nr:50S ribosomal protein L21 [Patescibacteria group bacterium]
MEYVVIETGGKQYRVNVGDVIEVDNLGVENGAISFDKVLLHVSGGDVEIGKPYLSGVSVSGTVVAGVKGKKIRVARFTAKSRHRKVTGFRASLSQVKIDGIVKSSGKAPVQSKASK